MCVGRHRVLPGGEGRGGTREVRVGLTSPTEPTQADGQNDHSEGQEHPQP